MPQITTAAPATLQANFQKAPAPFLLDAIRNTEQLALIRNS